MNDGDYASVPRSPQGETMEKCQVNEIIKQDDTLVDGGGGRRRRDWDWM